jgi:gliding motility-associated-like protein
MNDLSNNSPACLLLKKLSACCALLLPVALLAQTVNNGMFTGTTGNSVTPPGWNNVTGHNPGANVGVAPSVDVLDMSFSSFSGVSTVQASPSPQGGTWTGLSSIEDQGFAENEAIEQTVTGFIPGQQYMITYFAANFGGGMFNDPGQVLAFLDGNQIANSPTLQLIPQFWVPVVNTFTATATSHVLQIDVIHFPTNGTIGGYYSVDDVRITPIDPGNPPVVSYPPPVINPPNVITPNGDGINDWFDMNPKNVEELTVTILNRWGEVMLEVTGENPVWNGMFDIESHDATEGVYFYVYKGKALNGEELSGHGFVEVIR